MAKPLFPVHVGEKMQICRGGICFDSRLIGAIAGVSLLATSPMKEGLRIDFLEGEEVEARMFTGRDIYGFDTRVDHVCIAPVHYLHLAYPEKIRIQPLRHSPWIRVKLPAIIQAGGQIQPVLMTNLSEEGSKIDSPIAIGQDGERIRVAFLAEIDDMKKEIGLEARIEHAKFREDMLEYGISFFGASADERLWLKCLVCRGMEEGRLI